MRKLRKLGGLVVASGMMLGLGFGAGELLSPRTLVAVGCGGSFCNAGSGGWGGDYCDGTALQTECTTISGSQCHTHECDINPE